MVDKTESPSAGAKPRCSGRCETDAKWMAVLPFDFGNFKAGDTIYSAEFVSPFDGKVSKCYGPENIEWVSIREA